jgi:hypothetical protein
MSEIELLTALRAEWIGQRDSWPATQVEHQFCRFAIYALDEAIHSLENGFVWRYSASNISLFDRKGSASGYGPLQSRQKEQMPTLLRSKVKI